jgi:uncharacterized membrane protein
MIAYMIAVFLGVVAGLVNLKVDDLLLTALLVLAFTMALGIASPQHPWRWTLLVAACVPLSLPLARVLFGQPTYRAQVYGSFLGFLPGIVGAYGGAFMRRLIGNLFRET